MLPTPINNTANTNDPNSTANNTRSNQGTGFANIGSILNANQGAGAKIGQAVGDSIAGQANSVKAGIQASQDQFNTDSTSAINNADSALQAGQTYVRGAGENNSDYVNTLDPGAASTPAATTSTSGTSTPSTTTTPATTSSASPTTPNFTTIGTNIANAAYTGPTALNNADQLTAQAANVAALGQLAGTGAGQSQLIRSQVAQNGQYSTGENALDSLLLANGGQQYLQPARSQAAQIGSQATNAVLNSANQATAATSGIVNDKAALLTNLQNSLTGNTASDSTTANPLGITGLVTDAQNQATAYTDKAQRLQQLIAGKDINGNRITVAGNGTDENSVLSDSDKALLQNMATYGISPASLYADPNNTAATDSALGNFANNLTTNLGTQYYTGNQNQAAQNLATLLSSAGGGTSAGDIANIASYGAGGSNAFNTDIQSDTQAGNSQGVLNALANGINSSLASDTSKANDINRLINSYGNIPGTGNTNLTNLDGAMRGDLYNTFKTDTGLAYDDLDSAAANKSISSILNPYFQQYSNAEAADQASINNNTNSIQNVALQRLLNGT